ncbi:hypothetical protein ACM66B_003288 [Microbotryomycetes sp. NB124-2]
MGQTLSEPVTDKHTDHGEDDRLAWAVSEMQGWRLSQSSPSVEREARFAWGDQTLTTNRVLLPRYQLLP